ncbi:MAG: UDP-glucose 4-epimerase GalE [Akkermansiaceae bacterium]|nr:UDP-glucose 4-epimerase GalE [Akkermansiaceae bacterium]NNM31131.1 UDP-glucose 4-epimerase GalE [Akkermansiaceae bacterium]
MRVLVTGGAGYIGSHAVRALVAAGHKVSVVDSLVYGHREALVDDSVELVVGNLGNEELLGNLFKRFRPDAIMHFAAFAYVGESVDEPLKYYRNNLAAPLVLLEQMRASECRKFVFSSTCATYGVPGKVPIDEAEKQDPINPYGRSKLMLEQVLADCDPAWGLKSMCLRYFNASGASLDGKIGEDHDPETHLIPRILMAVRGEIPHLDVYGTDYDTPDGTCIRDYIHVEDLADAHVKALDHLETHGESNFINLGSGNGISVKEIIDAVEKVSGKKVPVKYGPRRPGDPPRLVADASKALEVLGWKTTRSDTETIVRTAWEWKGKY